MELLENLKKIAFEVGADVFGVASMDRFEGFPKQQDPRYIMPKAKSMIVVGCRTMRGSFRGTEEGTFITHYPFARGYVKTDIVPQVLRAVARIIENHGKEAMPINDHFPWAAIQDTGAFKEEHAVPVQEGLPYPDVRISMTHAAFLAGLGEIGYSGHILHPKYGPRLSFGCILTEMELPASPIIAPGTVCNRCMKCADDCPGGCISKTETETLTLGGYTFEIGKYDIEKCTVASTGSEFTEDGSYKPSKYSPFCDKPPMSHFGLPIRNSICAGRGCIRACMMNLEDRKAIGNLFDAPFRRHPAWEVDWEGYRSGRLVNDTYPPNAAKPVKATNIIDIDE